MANPGDLQSRAANMFRFATDRARKATEKGGQLGAKVLSGVKHQVEKIGTAVAAGYPSDSKPRAPSHPSSSSSSQPRTQELTEVDKIECLVPLGYSVAACRHALRVCNGQVSQASVWLSETQNQDEILAVEVAAQDEPLLFPGMKAQVHSLQGGGAQFNGAIVDVHDFDEKAGRWVVVMQDRSVKALRPRNLMPLMDHQVPPEADQPHKPLPKKPVPLQSEKAPVQESAAAAAEGDKELSQEALEALELRALARDLLATTGEPVGDEVLQALPREELQGLVEQLMAGVTYEPAQSASCRAAEAAEDGLKPVADPGSRIGTRTAGPPAAAVPNAVSTEVPALTAAIKPASGSPASAAEQPQKEGSVSSAAKQDEEFHKQRALEEQEQRLRDQESRLRAEAELQQRRAANLEAREAALRKAEAATLRPAPEAATSPKAGEEEVADLERQRAEILKLRLEAEEASRSLNEEREAARRYAEEKELQLLEEESLQLRMAETLAEEQGRLEQQKKSLLLMQQALMAARREPNRGCVELTLDDAACEAVEPPSQVPKSGSESESTSEEEEEPEVWDLDWSAVGTSQQVITTSGDASANATARPPDAESF